MKVLAEPFQAARPRYKTRKVVTEVVGGIGLLDLFALAVMITIAALNVW